MRIKINRVEATKASREIMLSAETFESDVKKFLAIIENLNIAWEGQDALKLINVLRDKYVPMLNAYSIMLKNNSEFIGKVFTAYATVDKKYSDKIKEIKAALETNTPIVPEGGN